MGASLRAVAIHNCARIACLDSCRVPVRCGPLNFHRTLSRRSASIALDFAGKRGCLQHLHTACTPKLTPEPAETRSELTDSMVSGCYIASAVLAAQWSRRERK